MLQRAVVVEIKGKNAVIETTRKTMCEGCEKSGGCGGHCEISGIVASNGKMRAEADNSIGARVGDRVEVESRSEVVLGYAALVFIIPILVCAAFYALFERLFSSETVGYIGAALGFALTFAGIALYDKFRSKDKKDIKIVNIISENDRTDAE